MRQNRIAVSVSLLLAFCVSAPRAVIFYGTGDPNFNSTAPTGVLTNSGWQLQGQWGSFLGTPIGPNHFLAATHVGGGIGDVFTFDGVQHTTTARTVDSGSDLTIWEVTPPFRNWAQLYTSSDEIRKRIVIFGRGTQRGAPVQVGGPLTPVIRGWLWGNYDGVQRWGENTVEDVLDADGNPHSVLISGVIATGPLLRATFDANGGTNEAALSWGDSSGGVFIQDSSGWKLAAINYAVDGPYNTSPTGAGFLASIFDEGGLYKGGENKWALTPDLPSNQAGAFYMTRISARVPWIRSIIGDPGLPPAVPVLEYSTHLNSSFTEDTTATFDAANMLIRTPNPQQQRFFRIRATQPIEITGLKVEGSDLVLTCRYQ
ncbi:MAG: hypothetical protein ACXW32_09455 [Limisphaerales bacterium]